jgi:two-component system phosphate regulon response regulator PhoB
MSVSSDPQQERLVLIIDDDLPIAEALALIVEELGYTPLIAMDGLTGLELAHSKQPRLILTDLMLPRLSGQQLITRLRTEQAARGATTPPIVVVTAGSRYQAREAGGDAYILKPFELEAVEAILQRMLGETEQHQ